MKLKCFVLVCALVTPLAGWADVESKPYDVLKLPAVPSELASKSLIYSISKFGDRFFATGHRGHILYSDDGGNTWQQAEVPVRSSILDIDFPTPELGWAVGHEGVILHSSDGGKTWVKQYDGLRYGTEGLAHYQALAEANPDNEKYPLLVEEMEFAISQGADKPLFRVAFPTATHGYALGAYGMILETQDGGEHWVPVLENVQNDAFYHIFDFAPLPGQGKFFASGEAGLLLEGDINEEIARRVETVPWEGSFFTIIDAADGSIVMGGLRGNMFRTDDVGATWAAVKKPMTSAIVDSARLSDGRLIAVGIGGEVLISTDNGVSFAPVAVNTGGQIYTAAGRIYAVAEGPPGTLLVGGPRGIHTVKLPQ
ncbi:MAG: YCF48-related protein [Halioglobus sp.]